MVFINQLQIKTTCLVFCRTACATKTAATKLAAATVLSPASCKVGPPSIRVIQILIRIWYPLCSYKGFRASFPHNFGVFLWVFLPICRSGTDVPQEGLAHNLMCRLVVFIHTKLIQPCLYVSCFLHWRTVMFSIPSQCHAETTLSSSERPFINKCL